ncbi:hypothetical protein BGX29_007453, partial [Mortierella sp. GBA35]
MGIPIELPSSPAPSNADRTDVASTTAAGIDTTAEIQSPLPTRARPHPTLRRISRVPVFMTSSPSSGPGSATTAGGMNTFTSTRPASSTLSTATSTTMPTAAVDNNDDIFTPGTTATLSGTMPMAFESMSTPSPPPASASQQQQ